MPCLNFLQFPLFVKWYITSKCNLRCEHCYLTDYTVQPDLDTVLTLVDYFASKRVVGIALLGGEPLARTDLEQIVERISSGGMRSKVATNGLLLSEKRVKALTSAGLLNYQVSLDSHDQEINDSIRGDGTFLKIIRGIEVLKSVDSTNTIIGHTLNRKNYMYVRKMYNLARDLGVDKLRFQLFVPIGTGAVNQEDLNLDIQIAFELKKEIESLVKESRDIEVQSPFPSSNSVTACAKTALSGCGAGTTTCVINSDMTISACDLMTETDRTTIKASTPADFERLWNQDRVFPKWRGEYSHDENHPYRDVNEVTCQAAYLSYKENIFV